MYIKIIFICTLRLIYMVIVELGATCLTVMLGVDS